MKASWREEDYSGGRSQSRRQQKRRSHDGGQRRCWERNMKRTMEELLELHRMEHRPC